MTRQPSTIIISRFRRASLITSAAIFLTALLSPSAKSHTLRFPEINIIRSKTPAGYPYLNGGIAFAEQRAMEHAAGSYNLKLVFASRNGTLLTPAYVVIGANHSERVERIALRAPWLYIRLPPGSYTILARFTNQLVLLRAVKIGGHGRKTYVVRSH